jgi:hypothetical protein
VVVIHAQRDAVLENKGLLNVRLFVASSSLIFALLMRILKQSTFVLGFVVEC